MSEKTAFNGSKTEGEQPIPIDYEPGVPEEVIGKCCYYDKCVWRTKIISTVFVAERIHSRELLRRVLSEYVEVSLSGMAIRVLVNLFEKWLRRYLALRVRGYAMDIALSESRPPKGFESLMKTLIKSVEEQLLNNPTELVMRSIHKLPETGWNFFTDESRCRSIFLVDPRYVELFLGDTRKYASRTAVNVAFCDDNSCYPVWKGVFPSKDYLSPAFYLVRRDVVTELTRKYGAWNFWDYVDLVAQPDEAGIAVYPGRRWTKVNLFFRVKDPARHAVTLSKLQSSVAKVVDQLMLISVEMLPPAEEPPGELDMDWDALRNAIEDYIRRKRSKKESWFDDLMP